jgi:hypothetical protein
VSRACLPAETGSGTHPPRAANTARSKRTRVARAQSRQLTCAEITRETCTQLRVRRCNLSLYTID